MSLQSFSKLFALSLVMITLVSSPLLMAREGVDSSGGGSAGTSLPIGLEELKLEVENLNSQSIHLNESISEFFFDFHSEVYKSVYWRLLFDYGDSIPLWKEASLLDAAVKENKPAEFAILQKLFPQDKGKRDIIEVAKVTSYSLEEKSPCLDLKGQAVDASAFPKDPNKICLSAPRLLAKLNSDNFKIQLRALAIHELSHKLGTTEQEAELLQALYLNPGFRTKGDIQGNSFLASSLSNIREYLEMIHRRVHLKNPKLNVCMQIALVKEKLTQQLGGDRVPTLRSFRGIRLHNQMEVMAIWTRVHLLPTYCYENNDTDRRALTFAFNKMTKLPMTNYLFNYYGQVTANPANGMEMPPPVPLEEMAQALTPGDNVMLEKELLELAKRVDALFAAAIKDRENP